MRVKVGNFLIFSGLLVVWHLLFSACVFMPRDGCLAARLR